VSCPACDYAFIVWPGGKTAELASSESASGDEAGSEDDESTAVANAEEIRKQVEQSVADEEGRGGSDEQQAPDPFGEQPNSPGQQESSSVGARQAGESAGATQAEESSPQEGGIPDFLEEAMDGTEEEGTVEMENPFLDEDGSMSVPEEFSDGADDSPEAPGPSSPAAPGPGTSDSSEPETSERDDMPDLSQGDPNATNPVPLEERQPDAEQQGSEAASSGFEDATQEISDPSSLVDDEEEANELFGGDLFGDDEGAPPEPSTQELDQQSQPASGDGSGGREREQTPVSGTSPPMQDQEMELESDPARQSPGSSPGEPSPTGEREAPKTDELEAGDVPDLANEERSDGMSSPDPSGGTPPSGANDPGQPADKRPQARGGARQQQAPSNGTGGAQGGVSAAQAQSQSPEQAQADEQSVSRLLVAVFVLLLAIFFVLLAGALGLFDLRQMLPGLSAANGEQPSNGHAEQLAESPAEQRSIDPMIRAGQVSLEANRLQDALRHFKTASMTAPESPRVHRLLAQTYHRLGEADRASSHRLRAMRLDVAGEQVTGRQPTRNQ
jgi:hypothetical protein